MKLRANLMMGLIGLALVAAPMTAAAQSSDGRKDDSHQSQPNDKASAARTERAPARASAEPRNVTSTREDRNDSSHSAARSAPREDRGNWTANNRESNEHRDYGNRDHDRSSDYRHYGDRDYDRDHDGGYAYSGPYVMPRGYYGGACGWAQHLRNVYNQDRNTGHPAAAADLLSQLHNAERACGGVPYGYLR